MHIAIVDANPPGLAAIRLAKAAGHRVTYLQPVRTQYALRGDHLRTVRSVDELHTGLDTTDPEAVVPVLAACHAAHPIDVAVTFQELAAEAVATACQRLGLRGTAPDAVFTARRKDRCRAALATAGLPSARYATADTTREALAAADRIGYPVVLKPPSGSASLHAAVARNPVEAAAACDRLLTRLDGVPPHWRRHFSRGVLVEEQLTGRMVSVEIGVRGPEFFPFCVSGRIRSPDNEVVELGSCVPADLPPDEAAACVDYAQRVCRAIGADHGVFHVEIMVTDRGPVLVEFNPRIMGGGLPAAYRHATGQHIHEDWLRLMDGGQPRVPPRFRDCTAVLAVTASADERLSPGATLAPLAGQPDVLEVIGFDAYRTGPGQAVAAGQAVARFILRAADRRAVRERGGALLAALADSLGIGLMTGDADLDR